VVIDYSAGMRKKITLATALLHTPRLLVLDEPFEAIDPVSAATSTGCGDGGGPRAGRGRPVPRGPMMPG
jgi:hypothetical protein